MRRIRILIAFLLCGFVAYQSRGAVDPNDLAHDLFGPSVNAVSVDAKMSGPEGAISKYSSKHSDIKTGSSSGVAFKTGGSNSAEAPGDDQLSKAIGKETAEAANMTVQFQSTAPRKTVRLNVTLVSEETPERLQNGFDDVFAVSLDGKIITFMRAADTKAPTDQQKSENPNAPRTVNVSKTLDLSESKLHHLKISIASVGDGRGPSTAIVSVDAEPGFESDPSSLAGKISHPGPPGPPGRTDPPRIDHPEVPKKGSYPPPPPVVSAPPPPSIILEGGGNPVPVPDRANSFLTLLGCCVFLVFLRHRKNGLQRQPV